MSPGRTVYRNAMSAAAAAPPPGTYSASLAEAPVSSSSRGEPSTTTGLLNDTVMLMREPAPYAPAGSGEVTRFTAVPGASIAMSLEPLRDRADPGEGSARSAALPASSATAPPLADSAVLPA